MSERAIAAPAARVAVIMPAYNTGRFIAEAIESVVAQTYQHWQLIVVNDGSTDDTGDVADRLAALHGNRITVVHQRNAGIAGARNRALAALDPASEFVSFLDSDDVWFPTALETMVEALRANASVVGVHGYRTYIDRHGKVIQSNGETHAPLRRRSIDRGWLRQLSAEEPTTYEVLAYGCCVFTGALLVRTDAILGARGFDPQAVPAEDWDMWLRLSLLAPFAFLQTPLYGYRLHGNNSTSDTRVKNRSLYFVRDKFAHDHRLPPAIRATMIAGFRWYERYRAAVCFRQCLWRARAGSMRGALEIALRGMGHLWTSVVPGERRLQALGASGERSHG